ncbi:MAG: MBOAT family protein [Eubacterium sp.]|nr:MBOAT family protein [Eubacterium sp.]
MVFSSLIFLCYFLPATVILYYACPAKFRNVVLLIASLFFYAWGEPVYICIMLFSTVFDYINGRILGIAKRLWARRTVLVVSICGNLGILFFFKYRDFLVENINNIAGTDFSLMQLALPIGISFYTFQTMSYTIDVYRGKIKPQKNVLHFATYVCLFPQLIAGPIVRYKTIQHEIATRKNSFFMCYRGLNRFVIGLGKKVILANTIGALWEEIRDSIGTSDMSVLAAWLGAVCFTFQIYFDFSGYSDMAIGLGKFFGFHFTENFKYPYESKSITEFWRRWHISMGTWFRDYVYIPLGGNRKGPWRQVFNLLIVWFLTGLWHGASWNFVIWGMYYFVFLFIEKKFLLRFMKKWPGWLRHVYSLLFIVIGWVIFACDNMDLLGSYSKAMIGIGVPIVSDMAIYDLISYAPLFIVLIIASTSLAMRIGRRVRYRRFGRIAPVIITIAILALVIPMLIRDTYNPFLYFRF